MDIWASPRVGPVSFTWAHELRSLRPPRERSAPLQVAGVKGCQTGGGSNGGASRSGFFCPSFPFFGTTKKTRIFCPYRTPKIPRKEGENARKKQATPRRGKNKECSPMVPGFSRFVPFLFLGLLRAPTRNSPERVRDTIWSFPEKRWETPRFGNPPPRALRDTLMSCGKN